MSDYTHTLPEWEDPHGSSMPIDPRTILEEAGLSPADVQAISAQLAAVRSFRANVA